MAENRGGDRTAAEEPTPATAPAARPKPPWPARFRAWWNLPRGIGLVAALVGLLHYLPLPVLPVPALIKLHADVAPELIGIGITLILIDWAVERRQRENRKGQLVRQLGSRHADVAEMARLELEHEGWLYDGTLRGAPLRGANLEGADLRRADLTRAALTKAILIKAKLVGTNLTGAKLRNAKLIEARMQNAILAQANLTGAKVNQADLTDANLTAANLRGADLSTAILWGAVLDLADLTQADLSQVKYWTVAQLERAKTLAGATMPDELPLGQQEGQPFERSEGLTFAEWRDRYLAQHGGAAADMRNAG